MFRMESVILKYTVAICNRCMVLRTRIPIFTSTFLTLLNIAYMSDDRHYITIRLMELGNVFIRECSGHSVIITCTAVSRFAKKRQKIEERYIAHEKSFDHENALRMGGGKLDFALLRCPID